MEHTQCLCDECVKNKMIEANRRIQINFLETRIKELEEERKDIVKKAQFSYIEKKLDLIFEYIKGKKQFTNGRTGIDMKRLRNAAKIRDEFTCQHCKVSIENNPNITLEVHHLIPKSKGGRDELCNLITLCVECHRLIREDEFIKRKDSHGILPNDR